MDISCHDTMTGSVVLGLVKSIKFTSVNKFDIAASQEC